MEPILFQSSKGYNPDFGAYLRPKCYMEKFNPALYALELQVKEAFADYKYGNAQEVVNTLAKIIETAKAEDWAEKPLTLEEVFAKANS